jgi:pilus assembly protein CpaF
MDMKTKVHQYFIQKTDFLKVKDKLPEAELRTYVANAVDELCRENKIELLEEERLSLIREMVSSVVSFGPIRPLMEDKSISEIMVNGPNKIYVQRNGRIEETSVRFESSQQLFHTIQKILGASGSSRRVDESSPYVDFSLDDGSRVNVILPPVSLVGPVMTIRKFSAEIRTVDDLIERNMLNKEMAAFLVAAIKAKLNIVFCGATGTGKTTLLNVLSRHIPVTERIVTIEDTAELRLLQDHVVSLQSKSANVEGKGAISIRELFVNSLRMRPDRILLGEVRGEEALDLIQSITSGHTGSLAIVHADSPEDCFNRLVTLVMMSGIRLNVEEIKKQIARAIDLIVHVELFIDGRRRITNITDIYDIPDQDKVVLENVFTLNQGEMAGDGQLACNWTINRKKPSFYKEFTKRNVAVPQGLFE